MAEESARVAWRSYHDWVLPTRAVQGLLAGALLFLFLGLLLLAIGGALAVTGLIACGAVLAGIGGCGLMVCLLLCLHAYFIFNVRDQGVQTSDLPWAEDYVSQTQEVPGYAVISKPSSLKSADSLRRNGGGGVVKKVTMAPDVALDADVRAPALRTTASGDSVVTAASPNLTLATPASPGYRQLGSYAVVDTVGAGGGGRPASGGGTGMECYDQRSFFQQQPVAHVVSVTHRQPANQQAAAKVSTVRQQQLAQRERDLLDIEHQRRQLELHRQHLIQQQQEQQQQQHHQQQQQQRHHFRLQQQQQPSSQSGYLQTPRYTAVPVHHSPSPSLSSQQSSVFGGGSITMDRGGTMDRGVTMDRGSTMDRASTMDRGGTMDRGSMMTGSPLGTAKSSSSFQYHKIQTQGLQYASGRPYVEDDDYDNPAVERTPMLMQSPGSPAPPPVGVKGVSFSGSVKDMEVEIPEPAPLQHPSERRPMTFEQQSSSKMSIYDNVLFPGD